MRRRFIAAHNSDFMAVLVHIFCDGAAAHCPYQLVDVAVAADRTAHDADLVAGDLIARITNCRTDVLALIYNPAESWNPDMRLAIDNCSIAWLRFSGCWCGL